MYLVTFVNLHYNEAAQQGEGLNFEARAVVIATGFGSRLVGGLGLGKIGDFVMGAQAEVETIGVDEVEVGTHTIFAGELVGADVIKEGEPMTYAYYHQVKRGTTPKTAPSYIEEKKEVAKVPKYKCTVCGYIYDPELGDPDGGIKPGTPFDEIPADWVCPVCGAAKDEFERIE